MVMSWYQINILRRSIKACRLGLAISHVLARSESLPLPASPQESRKPRTLAEDAKATKTTNPWLCQSFLCWKLLFQICIFSRRKADYNYVSLHFYDLLGAKIELHNLDLLHAMLREAANSTPASLNVPLSLSKRSLDTVGLSTCQLVNSESSSAQKQSWSLGHSAILTRKIAFQFAVGDCLHLIYLISSVW